MDESAGKGLLNMVEVKGSEAAIPKRRKIRRIKAKGFDNGLPLRGCVASSSDPVLPATLDNFSMDESAVKVEVKISDAAIPETREIGRIMVTGFDRGLLHDDVESALRKHFSSCGEITDVYIPLGVDDENLFGYALIYFVGEGAVDKALQLNGSDVGGWNVSARALPFPKNANCSAVLSVKGYDTSLLEVDIKSALDKLFSSCGTISKVLVSADSGLSLVFIDGEDVAVKAPQLSGSYMGGRQLAVELTSALQKSTVHYRPRRRYIHGGPNCCGKKPKKAKISAV